MEEDRSAFRDQSLNTYTKFSEKLTFLTPRYAQVSVRIRGLEMLVFRKILRTYLMDSPLEILEIVLKRRSTRQSLNFIVGHYQISSQRKFAILFKEHLHQTIVRYMQIHKIG